MIHSCRSGRKRLIIEHVGRVERVFDSFEESDEGGNAHDLSHQKEGFDSLRGNFHCSHAIQNAHNQSHIFKGQMQTVG